MNNVIKKVLKVVLFSMPAISLVVANSMFFPFITGKNFIFRITVELCTFLYFALLLVDSGYRPKWNMLSLSFLGFTVIMLVADLFAVNTTRALWSNFERMEGFVTIGHLFAYYIVIVSSFTSKRDWAVMLYSTTAVSICMTFFSFLQFFGGAVINQGGTRLDGTIGNSAYLASYLLFHVFFLLYLWADKETKHVGIINSAIGGSSLYIVFYFFKLMSDENISFTRPGGFILLFAFLFLLKACWFRFAPPSKRLEQLYIYGLFGSIIVAELIILYYTATRGAILGLIGGMVLCATVIVVFERENKRFKKIATGVLIALVAVIISFLFLKGTDFVQNSPVLNRFASISWNENKTQARGYIWPMAIKAFHEHPILGWGQDNFIYAFSKFYIPEMVGQEPWFDRAHNAFLDWLVAGGILGCGAYLLLYVSSLVLLVRNKKFSLTEKAILTGLLSAYAFQNIFIFDNLVSYMLFVLSLGLIGSSFDEKVKEEKVSEIDGAMLSTILALFLVCTLAINYKPLKQNLVLTQGMSYQKEGGVQKNLQLLTDAVHYSSVGELEAIEQLQRISDAVIAADAVTDQDKNIFANKVLEELKRETEVNPYDVRAFLFLGTFLINTGLYDEALPVLQKANEMSPNKQQIHYAIAQAYFGKASKDPKFLAQGVAILKQSYDLAPDFDATRAIYATGLTVGGQYGEAIRVARLMEDPGPFLKPMIVSGLIEHGFVKDTTELLQHSILVNPSNYIAYTLLSDIYLFKGDKQTALSWLDKMVESNPGQKELAQNIKKKIGVVTK